jgi:hypothetical protein
LVGTKMDLGFGISHEDIQEITNEYNIDYILISSKTGENFDYLIEKLKSMVYEPDPSHSES